jgi:hypothetical protein
MKVKTKGGYKIRLESGRLLPKVYVSAKAADERIRQLKAHGDKPKGGK